MADTALFIGWNRAVSGREQAAMELFGESMALYGRLVGEGKLASFEPVILAPHGGDLGGFVLLRGSAAQIDAFRRTAEYESLMTRANLYLEGIGGIDAWVGDGVARMMGMYAAAIPK